MHKDARTQAQAPNGWFVRRSIYLSHWRDGSRAIGRPEGTHDEAGPSGILRRALLASLLGETSALEVELVHVFLHVVVGHGDGGPFEKRKKKKTSEGEHIISSASSRRWGVLFPFTPPHLST